MTPMYVDITEAIVSIASQKSPDKRSYADKLMLALASGGWLTTSELAGVYYKFGTRFSELERRGVQLERERVEGKATFRYRLAKADHDG